MQRRTLLSTLGTGTLLLAGCPSGTGDLPADCPTSQGLDVEWPEELDASTVASFVEEYEHVYYRDVVVEYEPETRLDSYELNGGVDGPPEAVGDGWELAYSGGGAVYTPTLRMDATTAALPEGERAVPASDIDDARLTATLEAAAETGAAELHIERSEGVDSYLDLLGSVSDAVERLSERGDTATLYVDVDGTVVELSVAASRFHGDYGWYAWYYVDEHVVRRTSDRDVDPREGELLECRTSG